MAVNPTSLENLTPFPPGESGNPKGRPTAGATIREWINQLVLNDLTEQQLRETARDKKLSAAKRIAAERILKAIEAGDVADFQPYLSGEMTLVELREMGVNTEVVKKAKVSHKGDREIELYDRAGGEMDRLIGHTELSVTEINKNERLDSGKPTERIVEGIDVNVPGMKPG